MRYPKVLRKDAHVGRRISANSKKPEHVSMGENKSCLNSTVNETCNVLGVATKSSPAQKPTKGNHS